MLLLPTHETPVKRITIIGLIRIGAFAQNGRVPAATGGVKDKSNTEAGAQFPDS
jgi:hypothetical protein